MNYINFDRHEVFSNEILGKVSNMNNEVTTHLVMTDQSCFNDLTNKLAGLYDGYLYSDVLDYEFISQFVKDEVLAAKVWNLCQVINVLVQNFEEKVA
tara:strand:+ start:2369 stop:2659 length:291 start_codon:yes stop_codon:yes gene_type:complete